MKTQSILGYAVTAEGASACVDDIAHWVARGDSCRWLACINPHSYVVAADTAPFRAALCAAHWLIPDGVGIVLAARALGGHVHERVTGWDVFEGLNRRLNATGGTSAFLLGSTEETLRLMRAQMTREFPNIRVAGVYSPPFRQHFSFEEQQAMVTAVNATGADVLWVSMTAPKQELWIHSFASQLDVRFAGAIGAVFDFYTGRVARSSPVFQKLGLEWLPRLVREPRRLWRRTFVSAPRFVLDVGTECFRRGTRRRTR